MTMKKRTNWHREDILCALRKKKFLSQKLDVSMAGLAAQ